MYSKNIRNNPRSGLWNFEDIVTIGLNFGKLEHNRSKIQVPMQNARFSANLWIYWNSQETFFGENQMFSQYICPMHFLKNRNYDLFKLKFLPRGFVQTIRIKGLITSAH